MKTHTIYTLQIDTDGCCDLELCLNRPVLLKRLLEIMRDRLEELQPVKIQNGKKRTRLEHWRRKCLKQWTPRIQRAIKSPAQIWPTWKAFVRQNAAHQLRGADDFYTVHVHAIPLPIAAQDALKSAHAELVNYHRVMWHADKKNRDSLEYEALVKTIREVRKIIDPHDPICKGGAK